MALRVYRVCRSVHAALDGEGAKHVGGRWNSPGHAVVYMAQSVALAVLENLVHMSRQDFPVGYVTVSALIPDDLLIFDVNNIASSAELQRVGDSWLASGLSCVLRVPSAVISNEHNYLMNPRHADFGRIHADKPVPFQFDVRLFRPSVVKKRT